VNRLLLDQGLPRSAGTLLQQTGWDVVHASENGMSRASDADILKRARAEALACVTLNVDFHSLLATGGERGPSVIRIRKEGLDAAAHAVLLQGIWPRIENALSSGALVTVIKGTIRVRQLPIVRP
jgi:predicted nuclease of predicted toxin-antitoxin system